MRACGCVCVGVALSPLNDLPVRAPAARESSETRFVFVPISTLFGLHVCLSLHLTAANRHVGVCCVHGASMQADSRAVCGGTRRCQHHSRSVAFPLLRQLGDALCLRSPCGVDSYCKKSLFVCPSPKYLGQVGSFADNSARLAGIFRTLGGT